MKLLLQSVLLLSICVGMAFSQPWMQDIQENANRNFYDIQRSFEEYWDGKDHTQKGKGWKQFKRWEWFWEQRVYPTGHLPDPMHLYNESQKVAAQRGTSGEMMGGSWTELGPSQSGGGYAGLGRLNCVRIDPNNASIIWVGSASGGLWKSTNNGSTWSSNTDQLPTLGVTDIVIDPVNSNIMYIATGDGDAGDTYSVGVLKSTDGGQTWSTTGLNWATSQSRTISRLHIHPANSNILIAAGSNGIHKTADAGATWTQTSSVSFKDMVVKPGAPTTIYASRGSGQVYRSTNTGGNWTQLSSGIPTTGGRVALAVTPANPEYVYALYAATNNGFGGLYRSTNSGTNWTLMSSSPNILGWNTDGGDTGGQGWYDLALATSPTNADEIYTGGVNIWKSTNGGANWSIVTMWYSGTGMPAVHADQHDLWFAPGTNTLYVGNDGGIYRTTDGGSTWSWLGSGLKITQFYRLGTSATNANRIIAGAQDNGTKLLNNPTWTDVIGGDGMECIIDYSNANIMYGALYYGSIRRSTNGGSSFTTISGGISESGAWVTPYVIHPTIPTTLFGGYINVWQTTDRGNSWTAISAFGGSSRLTILAVASSNPQVIYAGTASWLQRTTNGGTSWSALSLPSGAGSLTYLAVHPTDPNTIWVTSSGYSPGNKVYRSTNGGASWTNISGSLPNVPVNCVVYENGSPDRIYVGTDIGVYYRDNSTPDWQDFNNDLANVVVTELEIHYGSNTIRAATYGRGIWESPLASQTMVNVPVATNWNLVSVPLVVSDYQRSTVFPSSNSQAFEFVTGSGYQGRDTLRNRPGYWLKFPASTTVPVVGVLIPVDTFEVAAEWNLIGSISVPIHVSSVDPLGTTIESFIYSYLSTGYNVTDTIHPGKGYWVKVSANGKLVLGSASSPMAKYSPRDVLSQMDAVRIEDASGATQVLYFGVPPAADGVERLFSLPPAPPAGVFDARFAHQQIATFSTTEAGAETPIVLSSATYPLHITWKNVDPGVRSVLIAGTHRIPLPGSGEYRLHQPVERLALSLGGTTEIPTAFALEQNYPNPFNPVTQIGFALPSESMVRLEVFNILGQQVRVLLNENRPAGYHIVEWNGRNDPGELHGSGVYLYRLTAGGFMATEKMMLVR